MDEKEQESCGDKKAEAEVGTVAEGERTSDRPGERDDEGVARTVAAIAATVVADGLKLQRAEPSHAKLKRMLAFVKLLDGGGRPLRVQGEKAEQVMRARADLPAAGVHFRTPIAEGLGVARRNERRA